MFLAWSHAPWLSTASRARLPNHLQRTAFPQLKNHFSASLRLNEEPPSAFALRHTSYPSESPDTSIFEDISDEYNTHKSVELVDIPSAQAFLRQAVYNRQFERAERLLEELRGSTNFIEHARVFEVAAIHALECGDTEGFIKWFKLFPDAVELNTSNQRHFTRIRRLLLHESDRFNVNLLMRFGRLCAKKGYASGIWRFILPTIVRFSPLDTIIDFLGVFNKLSEEYYAAHPSRHWRRPKRQLTTMAQDLIRLTTLHLCMAGRAVDAARFLCLALQNGAKVSARRVGLVLESLRSADSDMHYEREIWKLYSGRAALKSLSPFYLSHQASALKFDSLAQAIRSIKSGITPTGRPNATDVVDILEAYVAAGRYRAIPLLRRKAFNISRAHRSWWALIEMQFHCRRKDWRRVIKAYTTYFFLVNGTSDHHVRRILQEEQEPEERQMQMHESTIYPYTGLFERMWPHRSHTALLLAAVVSLTQEGAQIEQIWSELLKRVHMVNVVQSTPTSRPELVSVFPLLTSASANKVDTSDAHLSSFSRDLHPNSSMTLTEAHFTPFFRAFTIHGGGPARAAQVLFTMRTLGYTPNVHHFSELAGAFAHHGDSEKALKILEMMEASSSPSPSPSGGAALGKETAPSSELSLPAPTLVTYTSILRGFVHSRKLSDAGALAKRLLERFEYKQGTSVLTDAALEDLKSALMQRKGELRSMNKDVRTKRGGSEQYQA